MWLQRIQMADPAGAHLGSGPCSFAEAPISPQQERLWLSCCRENREQEGSHQRAEEARPLPQRPVPRPYGRPASFSGFFCREAIEAYERWNCHFIVVARKTRRLVEQLQAAEWKPSPDRDAEAQCEFWYQPEGWSKAYRFIALRYEKESEEEETEEPEPVVQYQLFATAQYKYRVFVTDMDDPIHKLVWFYKQRATAENRIKEANNDAGLKAHPSGRFMMNQNHFQLTMLAYNLNCWLMLFNREETATVESMQHTTLATARLRFLFLAAKIWCHAGRTGVSYSDH